MTYSVDFRRKVLSVRAKEVLTMQGVPSRFDMGVASVMRWVKRVVPQQNRHKPTTKIDARTDFQEKLQIHRAERRPIIFVDERGFAVDAQNSWVRNAGKTLLWSA